MGAQSPKHDHSHLNLHQALSHPTLNRNSNNAASPNAPASHAALVSSNKPWNFASVVEPFNDASIAPPTKTIHPHHRQLTASTSSSLSSLKLSISGGFFAFAAAALDKITEPSSRSGQPSSPNPRGPARLPVALDSPPSSSISEHSRSRASSNISTASTAPILGTSPDVKPSSPSLPGHLISSPYTETDPNRPQPLRSPTARSNMHQTSSRLLRMTDDERPFTKDFKDLFSTLIVSLLPLSPHRVRLTRVEHTFLSEDAINNLGSLKFSQSNRMPDPKDASRIVTTTTTTTFSMAKDMARSICQRFLDARFIESADGKLQSTYTMKGSVWQLTPKGVAILDRFCARNGIQQKQIENLINAGISSLVILERESALDKLVMDRGTMEVVFRRFIGGASGLNLKSSVNAADDDSLDDYRDGSNGVKIASERKVNGSIYKDTWTGKACSDWLMNCCTTVARVESYEMGDKFVEYDLMESIQSDRVYMHATGPTANRFQPTKNAIYQMTARGREIVNGANGTGVRGRSSEGEGLVSTRPGIARDSNTQRLEKILNDHALRLLFRENLRETHCEENLSFYLDVDEFVRSCKQATRSAQMNQNATSMDGVKEIMAQAYGIYNAFLAPGSPCELNIDHQLRNNLATRMTKAVGQDGAMIETLREVTTLFEDAQTAVFKLMASDSVPKFLRNAKYEHTLKHYDFDSITLGSRLPERSQSRSNRK